MILHIKTPLIQSPAMSRILDRPVFLKLENLQTPGSFKIRGIGLTCQIAKEKGFKRLVGSSGGNAGLAMAYAANQLSMPITLFIPTSTPTMMIELIKAEQVEVRVIGQNWNEANAEAEKFLQDNPDSFFVHPYDQESTWTGHSSIVHEIKDQLEADFGIKDEPGAIVTCVGGGGLAIGLCNGMEDVNWNGKVPLITMETQGSNCFNEALKQGKIVTLDGIHSIAKSLGALSVSSRLFDLAQQDEHQIKSYTVTDQEALEGCLKLAQDHRMLVEPACGAALASIYCQASEIFDKQCKKCVVMVVCGGNMASLELFQTWKQSLMKSS